MTDKEYFAESVNDASVAKLIHIFSLNPFLLSESFCMVPIRGF
jgi:hypothetical protein